MCDKFDPKNSTELLRKLQNKLRKQRQDLHRTHQYNLKQKLKEQRDRYEKELQSAQSTVESELQKQSELHQQEFQSLKEELQSLHQLEIAEKQTQCHRIQQTNNDLSAQLRKIQKENTQLKHESDQLTQQKESIVHKLNDEVINIQHDITHWITNRQSHPVVNPKQFNLADIETELFNINKKSQTFIEERQNIWNQANKDLESIKMEFDDKENVINGLNNELNTVKAELQHKIADIERIANNYQQDLVRGINEYKVRIQNMNKEIESQMEHRRKLEAEVVDVTESNNEFLDYIKEIEKKNIELQMKDTHNQQIIIEMKNKSDKNTATFEEHQKHILSLQMELQNTVLSKKDISTHLAEKSDELLEYKAKLAMNQASSRKQICALEIELQDALNELRDKAKHCERLKQKVERIANRLQTQQNPK